MPETVLPIIDLSTAVGSASPVRERNFAAAGPPAATPQFVEFQGAESLRKPRRA